MCRPSLYTLSPRAVIRPILDFGPKQHRANLLPMPVPERFSDGSFRFSGGGTAFTFQRLRPGVMLTTATGFDRGEVGDAPLRVVEAEVRWFRTPLEWFIDARQADNANSMVFTRWTEWLGRNAGLLKRLHVLTGGEPMRLTVSIARHLAGAAGILSIYEDPAAFRAAVNAVVPAYSPATADPQPVECEVVRDPGRTQVRSSRSVWVLEPISPATLLARVAGTEEGILTDLLFEEVERGLSSLHARPAWFVDLSAVRTISSAAVDNWAAWLDPRRNELSQVHVLAPSSATGLLLAISRFRSNLAGIIRLHESKDEFEAALKAAAAPAMRFGSGG